MPSNRHNAAAAERKRLRDRVAQQNLRNKRNRHIQTLEHQVKLCHELHGSQDNEDLLKTIRDLRAENNVLRERQQRLQALFNSFKDVLEESAVLRVGDCPRSPQSRSAFALPSSEPPSSPQQPTPPESSQDFAQHSPDHQSTSASSTSAQCHQLLHDKEANASGYVNYSFLLEESNTNADRAPDTVTAYATADSRAIEIDDLDKTGVDNIHLLPNTHDYPIPSSLVPSANDGIAQDLLCPRPTTPHDLSGALNAIQPDFPDHIEPYDPFTDTRLWNLVDFFAYRTCEDLPVWARIPVRTQTKSDIYHAKGWDSNIRVTLDSPDNPAPLDLMFGSSQNPLANALQRSVKRYYPGERERLAMGWLTYYYIKWRTQPSIERYSRVPNCLKPLPEQTQVPHPGCLDLIFWEDLRLSMMKNFNKYDMEKLIRLYCDCLRLRWSKEEEILVPNADGKHILRPEFIAQLMSEVGWGLKAEFINQYPELFDGLDWKEIVYVEET